MFLSYAFDMPNMAKLKKKKPNPALSKESRNNDEKARLKASDTDNNRSMKYSPVKSVTSTPLGNNNSQSVSLPLPPSNNGHSVSLPPASSGNSGMIGSNNHTQSNSPVEEAITGLYMFIFKPS